MRGVLTTRFLPTLFCHIPGAPTEKSSHFATWKLEKSKNLGSDRPNCGDVANWHRRDSYKYAWIDTCCIDKTNNVELSEAINSMFRWYKRKLSLSAYPSYMSRRSGTQCMIHDASTIPGSVLVAGSSEDGRCRSFSHRSIYGSTAPNGILWGRKENSLL